MNGVKSETYKADDNHELLIQLADRLELALSVTSSNRSQGGYPSFGNGYTGCRFCKSMRREIKNCDHPNFNVEKWKKAKDGGGKSYSGS